MIVNIILFTFKYFFQEVRVHRFLFRRFPTIAIPLLKRHRDRKITLAVIQKILSNYFVIFHINVSITISTPHFVGNMFEGLPNAIFHHLFLGFFQFRELPCQIIK